MRITSMTIKNFKGIDEHGIRIDFAPITMLFGPNNAGKSTVIQAMHLAREVLCHNNADADNVQGGGESISLGSFKDYVHKHEEHREVILRFDMEVDELPEYSNNMFDLIESSDIEKMRDILSRVYHIAIELCIARSSFISYALYINDNEFTKLFVNEKFKIIFFNGCDPISLLSENIVNDIYESANIVTHYEDEGKTEEKAIENLGMTVELIFADFFSMLDPFISNKIFKTEAFDHFAEVPFPEMPFKQHVGILEYMFYNYITLPLDFENPFPFSKDQLLLVEEREDPNDDTEALAFCRLQLLSSLILGPGKLLKQELEKLLYIGPLRALPARNFIPLNSERWERWANGLAAWDALATLPVPRLATINQYLHGADSLQTGYSIQRKQMLCLDAENPLVPALRKLVVDDIDEGALPLLRDFLAQAPEIRLMLRNEATGVEIEPCDMGVGISQVIPVVVAATTAKYGGLVAIEQPELHIHPAWQTALGDVFIKAIAGQDVPPIFLLETHSEHLLLRLLRRIRHTHAGTAPETVQLIHTDLAVHWIGSYEGRTEAYRLGIDEDGSFNTPWPEGFFAERGEELFG